MPIQLPRSLKDGVWEGNERDPNKLGWAGPWLGPANNVMSTRSTTTILYIYISSFFTAKIDLLCRWLRNMLPRVLDIKRH